VLSAWTLRIDGRPPEALAVHRPDPFAATFVGRLIAPVEPAESTALVIRDRYVGDGMREDITIRNAAAAPATHTVTLTASSDFADLFEVKAGRHRLAAPAAADRRCARSTLAFEALCGEHRPRGAHQERRAGNSLRRHSVVAGDSPRPRRVDGQRRGGASR